MYIILEGMPGTGKTTIAKAMQKRLHAAYMKSVISDTVFGDSMKAVRSKQMTKQLELLFLPDLAMDELRVHAFLKKGSVVRDKSLPATIGHIAAHGFSNSEIDIQECLMAGYKQIIEYAAEPDLAVYLKSDKEKIFEHLSGKGDISSIDEFLFHHFDIYMRQDSEIEHYMQEIYKEKFYSIDCFSGTVDEMVDEILKRVELNAGKHGGRD